MIDFRNRDTRLVLLICACIALFFAMDNLVLPAEIREDSNIPLATIMVIAFFVAFVAAYQLPDWRHILYFGIAISVTISVFPVRLYLLEVDDANLVAIRRLLGLSGLWVFVFGAIQNKRSLQTIERMNASLETRVAERTALHQKANDRLRQIEVRLNEAQRIAGIGSWEWDIQKDEIWRSEELYRLLGVEADDFGAGFEDFLSRVHDEDQQKVRDNVQRALDGRGQHSIEHRIVLPSGEVRIVHRQGIVYFNENGMPVRMSGTTQDITERKNMQRRIGELLMRLEALTSVAFDGIVISENGRITEGTEQFAFKLGYQPDEVRGHSVIEYVAPAFRPVAIKQIQKKLASPFEIQLLKKDGTAFPAEAVGADITVDGKKMRVSAFRDISDRAELEREVIAIGERERRRIGRDLHDGVGQLLFGASLTLQSVCQQLSREDSPLFDSAKKAQHIIESSIDEARRVSHLLVPTAYGSGEELGKALMDLVARTNEHSAVSCTANCEYDGPTGTEETSIHLYRIAQESINNALKHSDAKNLELNFYHDGELLQLEILDDGIGISDEQMDQPGGLGVRSLHYRARMINGNLEMTRREGGGTRVLCSCPI